MSISITFSSTNGGAAISDPLDHGSSSTGDNTTPETMYIEHDGNNPITNCRLYVDAKSGAYGGSRTAAEDKADLLTWGDSVLETTFGGVQFNFDAQGAFPVSAWGSYGDKSPTNGNTIRSGVGDNAVNGIVLPVATGAPSAGVIPSGASPNVRFQTRIKIPSSGAGVNVMEFGLKLAFSYVS
jgi:hypothetical protein